MSSLKENHRRALFLEGGATLAAVLCAAAAALWPSHNFAADTLFATEPSGDISNLEVFLIMAAVFVGLGGLFGIAFLIGNRKARAWKEFVKAAGAMGLSLEPKDKNPAFLVELSQNLLMLKQGVRRVVLDVMRGASTPGVTTLFAFGYTNSNPGPRHTPEVFWQSVAAFRFPSAALPQFHLAPEHWWNKVGKALGHQAIGFESHPEFSKRYILRGADESAIRNFFQPALVDYFLSLPEESAWHVEAADQWLLLYHANKTLKAAELRSFWDTVATIAGNIANYAGLGRAV